RVGNGETNSATYLGSYTDSDGHYIIAGATAALTLNAFKYGFTFTNLTWTNPLAMTSDWASIDFVATAMPVVTITATTNVVSENNSTVQYFTLARSGDTTTNLTITVYLSGSANLPSDYTLTPKLTNTYNQIDFPPGSNSLTLAFQAVDDLKVEGSETATLTLIEDPAYVIGWPGEAAITILHDALPVRPTVTVTAMSGARSP